MADIDELRAFGDGVEQRGKVVPVLFERDAHRLRAELEPVDDVARKRRPAADDLIAGIEHRLRDPVDQRVGAGPDRDFPELHTVPLRERRTKPVSPTVRIAVQLTRRALQRLERLRERPERPLVRSELDDALEPELALNLFDRLSRLVRDDVLERGPEKAGGNLPQRHPAYVGVSSDFLRQNHNAPPIAAKIEAIADLFSPACSPAPGTASRAFLLPTFFATFHTPQPSTAFRRLTIPIALLSPVES